MKEIVYENVDNINEIIELKDDEVFIAKNCNKVILTIVGKNIELCSFINCTYISVFLLKNTNSIYFPNGGNYNV